MYERHDSSLTRSTEVVEADLADMLSVIREAQPRNPETGRFMSAADLDLEWVEETLAGEFTDDVPDFGDIDENDPEASLIVREATEVVDDFDTDESYQPDRYELMALAAEAEIAARGFSRRPSFRDDGFDDDDFFGHAEDFEEPIEEDDEIVCDWIDPSVDDTEDFCDRPTVMPGKFDAERRDTAGDRQRRDVLISRLRRARRAAQTTSLVELAV